MIYGLELIVTWEYSSFLFFFNIYLQFISQQLILDGITFQNMKFSLWFCIFILLNCSSNSNFPNL